MSRYSGEISNTPSGFPNGDSGDSQDVETDNVNDLHDALTVAGHLLRVIHNQVKGVIVIYGSGSR